jgi:hypothetical protein
MLSRHGFEKMGSQRETDRKKEKRKEEQIK